MQILASSSESGSEHEEEISGERATIQEPPTLSDAEKILAELKKNNAIVNKLCKKIKRTEQRILVIEEQLQSSAASSSNSTPKRPRTKEVPAAVRVSQ